MRGGGEGGEAADDGGLAVDVRQPGRFVAGQEVAAAREVTIPLIAARYLRRLVAFSPYGTKCGRLSP